MKHIGEFHRVIRTGMIMWGTVTEYRRSQHWESFRGDKGNRQRDSQSVSNVEEMNGVIWESFGTMFHKSFRN